RTGKSRSAIYEALGRGELRAVKDGERTFIAINDGLYRGAASFIAACHDQAPQAQDTRRAAVMSKGTKRARSLASDQTPLRTPEVFKAEIKRHRRFKKLVGRCHELCGRIIMDRPDCWL